MRAIFECVAGAYRQVGYWDVNGVNPVKGASNEEELAVYRAPHIVGYEITHLELEQDRIKFYLFSEGKNYNQLTLTDAREIYNMRKWIQSRDTDFIEVSCDEEAEHITANMFIKPVEEPKEEPVRVKKKEPQEEYSEFDLQLLKDMQSR